MSAVCPNGHTSGAEDFCDTCGAKIDLENQPEAAAAPKPEPPLLTHPPLAITVTGPAYHSPSTPPGALRPSITQRTATITPSASSLQQTFSTRITPSGMAARTWSTSDW